MKIKLYTQKGCPQCEGMKRMLEKKNIEYENIELQDANPDELKKYNIFHLPTLEVDDKKYIAKPMFDIIRGM